MQMHCGRGHAPPFGHEFGRNSDITSKLVWPLAAPWGCDLDFNISGLCSLTLIVFYILKANFLII